jgi:adenylate kinase
MLILAGMLAALTGIPGTGKSAVAQELRGRGWRVENVPCLAVREGLVEGSEVDLEALASKLRPPEEGVLVLEGHYSHLLPVGIAVVLRCNPGVLRERLERRGWSAAKIGHNVESEALDFITIEALDRGLETFEVDTTHVIPAEAAMAVEGILLGKGSGYRPGSVDWSEVILSWY